MFLILWGVFGLIQLGFTVYLALAFGKYKSESGNSLPSMSIIIAAHDEKSNLKKLMPELLDQDYNRFEIIISLDRCSDDSRSYLNSFDPSKVKVLDIDQIPENWNPKKYALNSAISKATGEWLIFTDADCVPISNRWLSTIAKHISSDLDIVIGVSPYDPKQSFLSRFIQFEAFMTAYIYVARSLAGYPYMAVGRNMALRKAFFSSMSGYEGIKSIQGGDDDLFIQKNASKNLKVMLGAESLVLTQPEKTWKDYWNQKTRHLSVGTKYKLRDQLFLSFYHISHLLFIILSIIIATQSFFLPVFLFYLFIKLVSYRFAASKIGININYILLPLVDILYSVLIPAIALWSKLVKDIKWKN